VKFSVLAFLWQREKGRKVEELRIWGSQGND